MSLPQKLRGKGANECREKVYQTKKERKLKETVPWNSRGEEGGSPGGRERSSFD